MGYGIFADLHFQEQHKHSTVTSDGITTRLTDMLQGFRVLFEREVKRGASAFLVLGDIFDSRTELPVSLIDAVCRLFDDLVSEYDRPITVLAGNHDSYLRNPKQNSLQALRGIVEVVESPQPWSVDPNFYLVPWNDDPEVIKKQVAEAVQEESCILCSHLLVAGLFPDKDKGVPLEYLHTAEFDWIILGDVHKHQFVPTSKLPREVHNYLRDGGRVKAPSNVVYVGSPWHLDYREAGTVPGLLHFHAADDWGLRFVENDVSPRFHLIKDSDYDVSGVGGSDYVRVAFDEADDVELVVSKVMERTKNVEASKVKMKDAVKPRIDVQVSTPDTDVLTRYCAFKGIVGKKAEKIVKVGLQILDEARG
jgi:hypothetical protein